VAARSTTYKSTSFHYQTRRKEVRRGPLHKRAKQPRKKEDKRNKKYLKSLNGFTLYQVRHPLKVRALIDLRSV